MIKLLDLVLLGSGGGMPMPKRHLSSLLLSYQGRKILIDCGEGTQVAMRKMNTGFKSIDIICITHFHGDHIFGLPGLLATIGNSDRTEPIMIIGPQGLKTVLKGILITTYLPYDIYIIENPKTPLGFILDSKLLKLNEPHGNRKNDIVIDTIELEHSSPCVGYSFYFSRFPKFLIEKALSNNVPKEIWKKLQKGENVSYNGELYEPNMVLGEERRGIKLSYITDSRPINTIPEFIKDSDLFVCEGTYGSGEDLDKAMKNFHMTFSEASNLASKGQVKELLLTHFSTSIENPEEYKEEAKKVFKNTIIGYDGLEKTIGYQ